MESDSAHDARPMLLPMPTVPALRWFHIGLVTCSIGTSLVVGGCADQPPPRFTGELTLALTEDQLAATWPAASDDVRVEAYLVHVDGAAVARLGRDTLSYTLQSVQERATRLVRVTAVDAAGNESAPLEASFSVPDRTAPRFPTDARMTATGNSLEVTLHWPPASDEGAVHYVVRSGERELGTVTEPTFTLPRAAVDADFSAETSVLAIDDADNQSAALVSRWSQFFSSPQERQHWLIGAEPPTRMERDEENRRAVEGLLGLMNGGSHEAAADILAGGAAYGSTADVAGDHGAAVSNPASGGCISPCGGARVHEGVEARHK